MRIEATTVAHRFIDAQKWWIAANLIARNSQLRLYQQVDLIDGEAIILELQDSRPISWEAQPPIRIVLGEEGLKLVAQVAYQTLFWDEIFSFSDPLEAVERIEASIGLIPNEAETADLPPRALAFMVIALTLAGRVNASSTFHVRSTVPAVYGVDGWALGDLATFPSLEEYIVAKFELDVAHGFEPRITPAWVLYEGLTPVAAFDEDGGLHAKAARSSLVEIHESSAGQILTTAMTVGHRVCV